MRKETFFIERESVPKYETLEKLLGENFNPEKTIKLSKDLDEYNEPRELGDYSAFWTEFRNPDAGEVVEGKVYLPEGAEDYKKILLVSPGYKGDFVLQEAKYADDFAKDSRAVIFLRHNGLRIEGDDVKNYIHCPEEVENAQKKNQGYIGPDEKFGFAKANREVLTALKALGSKVDKINEVDIIGHSWGARIALESMVKLNKEDNEVAKKLKEKVNNLILLGAWLETRKGALEEFRDFFERDASAGYFRGMDANKVMKDIFKMSEEFKKITGKDFPKGLRVVGIHSITDQDIDLRGEIMPFFERIKDLKKRGSIVLKDLRELIPEKIGGRESEVHDYALNQVRKWIGRVIE